MTHKVAAKFIVVQHTLSQRLSDRERGASALEYVGMLIVAAIIVGAVITVINDADVAGAVTDSVNEILDK
ncbi:hypothetical protein [Janibacter alittae]|uniref:Flp family type IVb pilin n=1 Tax=Janibacter alittae TaxID=3115209 RepID=A0ABZ2MH64_9MICO